MASIALRGPHQLAFEVVPGASLHFEALTPECGRGCLGTGVCGPVRHVGAGRWGLLGLTAHGCSGDDTRAPASATWLGEVGAGSTEIPHFWGGVQGMCPGSLGCGVSELFSSVFLQIFKHKKEKRNVSHSRALCRQLMMVGLVMNAAGVSTIGLM